MLLNCAEPLQPAIFSAVAVVHDEYHSIERDVLVRWRPSLSLLHPAQPLLPAPVPTHEAHDQSLFGSARWSRDFPYSSGIPARRIGAGPAQQDDAVQGLVDTCCSGAWVGRATAVVGEKYLRALSTTPVGVVSSGAFVDFACSRSSGVVLSAL